MKRWTNKFCDGQVSPARMKSESDRTPKTQDTCSRNLGAAQRPYEYITDAWLHSPSVVIARSEESGRRETISVDEVRTKRGHPGGGQAT